MKKTLLFAAIASLFTFASCEKAEIPVQNESGNLVFTAVIASQDTKTTVNAATGKVEWVSGDEITITDAASISARYVVSAISETTGVATFTKVSGEPDLGAGPYTAVYGSAPLTAQTYSATAPSLPMSATSSTTSLAFSVSCGLLELNLTAGESITSIQVTGTPTAGTETTYTLTCATPVSIASGEKFFIALPAGSYKSFVINGQNGAVCKKEKTDASVAINANHITPVSFSSLHFGVQLWADGPYWSTTNIGAAIPEAYGDYYSWGATATQTTYDWANYPFMQSGKSVSLYVTKYTFADGQTDGIWYSGGSFVGDNGDGVEHKDLASYAYADDAARQLWKGSWRVPTDAEWTALRTNCDWTWEPDYNGTGKKGMVVKGKGAFSGRSIFLPAAGHRSGTNLYKDGSYGLYWSSSLSEYESPLARYVYFVSEEVLRVYTGRYFGFSVRPVTE